MKCPYCIKICSKCGRLLVANTMNFRKSKDGKYGVRANCKNCESEYNKKYQKQYCKDNKEKRKEQNKQYYKDNKEKILKQNKQYYENNKEEILEQCKIYRENNKEKISEYKREWYESNKEKRKEYHKQWRENNPDKVLNAHNKRRRLKESQGSGINKDQWYEMMEFFNWKCAYSGEYIGGDSNNRTVDHIIPLSLGGEHEIWNLVPTYSSYNYSKYTSEMESWYIQQPFYSEERLNKIYKWVEYAKNKYKNKKG